MLLAVVLSVGFDSSLLESRCKILQSADCIVENALSVREAIDRLRVGDFDLILLCYSIPKIDRERLVYLVRKHRLLTPVVSVSRSCGDSDDFATATCEDGGDKLLSSLKHLLLENAELPTPRMGLQERIEVDRRARENKMFSSEKYDEQPKAGFSKKISPSS